MMAAGLEAKSEEHKDDVVNILILIFIASVLGVYLIATTVLIADDGVYYIEQAQKLSSDPGSVVKSHPPGYPYLIFLAHKFAMLFTNSSSVFTWIYAAQSVTFLCRLIALIPLYFLGKRLVGSRKSFWAILILIILPYPAQYGSDALRDWPHILFLAAGFLFLLWGAEQGKWWTFGMVGLFAGLGFIIRPECAQLIIYGVLWLLVRFLKPKCKMNRSRLLCALFILLIGFALPIILYVIEAERITPPKLEELLDFSKEYVTSFFQTQSEKGIESHNRIYTIMSLLGNITKAIGELIEKISDNLMHFFVPALLLGIYCRFRKRSGSTDIERFFVPVFIVFNVIIMILLYCSYGYIDRRNCMPLVVLLIFYVVIGLEVLGNWLGSRNTQSRSEAALNSRRWFFILLTIGGAICLPKLIRPIRMKKQSYRDAAKWLVENTTNEDLIAVPDGRIGFYAERDTVSESENASEGFDYIVSFVKNKNEKLKVGRIVQGKRVLWFDKRRRKYRLIIYGVL